ncbi:unnamed protein product [Leuciscus chuanchicus]
MVCGKALRKYKRKTGQVVGGRTEFVVIDESSFRHKRKSLCHSPVSPSALIHSCHPIITTSHQSLRFTSASVARLDLGRAGSQLLLDIRNSWLCLQPLIAPLYLDPSPLAPVPPLIPPLGSRVDHQPFILAGLSRNVGSAWVRHRHASVADLRAVRCSSALHPFSSSKLCPPSGSVSILHSRSLQLHICPHLGGLSLQLRQSRLGLRCFSTPSAFVCAVSSTSITPSPPVVPKVMSRLFAPWLLPPAPPPWSSVLVVAWVSICTPLFKAIPWKSSTILTTLDCPVIHPPPGSSPSTKASSSLPVLTIPSPTPFQLLAISSSVPKAPSHLPSSFVAM